MTRHANGNHAKGKGAGTMSTVRLDPPERLAMSLGEAMFTQRAIRRLRPDPVSDEDLKLLMDAASKAPNSRNEQNARFLVVRDRDRVRRFGELYREAWWAKQPADWRPEGAPPGDRHLAPMRLAEAMKDAPVVVLAVSRVPGHASSVLPSVQNLMLAARALGIGSVLTTLHPRVTERVQGGQHPAGSRGPLLHPPGLPGRPVRRDGAPARFGDHLLRGMGQPAAVGVSQAAQ